MNTQTKEKTKNETVLSFQNETARKQDLLWDMSEPAQVKDFITQLQMAISDNQLLTAGLVLLITEIENKPSFIDAQDFCAEITENLFTWTIDFDRSRRDYVQSLKKRRMRDFT